MKKLSWLRLSFSAVLFMLLSFSIQAQQTAATLIDDFEQYGDLASRWWSYVDDAGSTFTANVDQEVVAQGTQSLRLDANLIAEGFAGLGSDFSFPYDWREGEGLVFQVRATQPNFPLMIVLYLEDETQLSTVSPGITPFGCNFNSGAEWTTITLPWSCFERLMWIGTEGLMEFTPYPIAKFELSFYSETAYSEPVSIWFDDLRVISETDLNAPPDINDVFADLQTIQANQIGYRPQDEKWFVSRIPAERFTIVGDAGEVFAGTVEHWGYDNDSAQEIYRGNFNDLTEPGTYHIVLDSGDESYPFTVAEDVYNSVMWLAARAFYLQRSGSAIRDADMSGVVLDAGHLEPALLWDDPDAAPIDVSGGWYDAGDFGRYIPTAAFTVNQLLYAFEANADFFTDGSLDIPESGNEFPDLLDEIRQGLDWMLKMQREDGAVHHKVTTRNFPGYGALPAEDTDPLYVFEVTTNDTAYFAAVTAQASRIFEAYDPDYAAVLLEASERAWAWLQQNPEQVPPGGFHNPPVDEYPMQGGYDFFGDENVSRLWAAAELFKTTGNSDYQTTFAGYFQPSDQFNMSWSNVYPMALYAYLTAENADVNMVATVRQTFDARAQRIYGVISSTGYNVALSDQQPGFEFVWGSNQVAIANGLYLMLANELSPNPDYEQAARSQIHYVLGTNPLAKSYISGAGANPVMHPHHNASYRMQQPFPGLVTEGANSQETGGDSALQGLWDIGAPPALRYVDDWESWASNEPTIDANATFVALLAYWVKP